LYADRLSVLLSALVLTAAASAQTPPLPDEPVEGGEVLLAGRLPWGATALPTGEILAPDEDKTLTVLDAHARVLARWNAPDRFSAAVSVSPGAPALTAAPLLSGRVVVLAWDAQTRVLAPSYVPSRRSEAVATAWTASRTLVAAWKDGQVEAWQDGSRRWSTAAGFEARFLLADNATGVYVFGPGQAALLDFQGAPAGRWPLSGAPRGVLQTLGGTVVCWTDTGLWALGDRSFVRLDPSVSILGVAVDGQGKLIVTEPDRVRRLGFDGAVLSLIPLPRRAVTPAVIDDRGRLLIGTVAGLEEWTYDGRLIARFGDAGPSPVLITEDGLGAWGTADWKVHVWSGFRWPEFGWPQEGGGSGRAYAALRSAGLPTRVSRWTEDPAFTYLYLLASTGKEADQREVLDRIETAAAQDKPLWHASWLNLILLKVARSGLSDLMQSQGRVVNNWPTLRYRAFSLLARTAGPEDRDELIDLVHKEYDPAVLGAAVQAMTRWGWDGDGKLMRMLDETLSRTSGEAPLAETILDAARSLWQKNGRSADPTLVPLVQSVFQGAYPTGVKLKAQKFFQDLLSAP
jgi:hypothetical protein